MLKTKGSRIPAEIDSKPAYKLIQPFCAAHCGRRVLMLVARLSFIENGRNHVEL